MVWSHISRRKRVGWFVARYPEGEGFDGLEPYIQKEKGWMVCSYISRGRRVVWFEAIYPEGEGLDGL